MVPEDQPKDAPKPGDAEAGELRRVDYLEKLLSGEAYRIDRKPDPKPDTKN